MTRLLVVMALTLVAFFVALYTWNQPPRVACTAEGLAGFAATWETLAERRPRMAERELRKLADRTRLADQPEGYTALIRAWTLAQGRPDRRDCQRLQESIQRLW